MLDQGRAGVRHAMMPQARVAIPVQRAAVPVGLHNVER